MSKTPAKNRQKSFKLPLNNRNKSVDYRVLRETGCFSVDRERRIAYDRSQMKYYVPRNNPVFLDLNVGFQSTLFRSDRVGESEKMDHILKWIVQDKFKIFKTDKPVDFISHSGTLRKIMLLSYSPQQIICASKFCGKIYMVAINSDSRIASNREMTENERRSTSWGYKFEEYMTADVPWGEANALSTTHEIEEFCTVVQAQLADHSILLKVEIDGMHSGRTKENSDDPSRYVEMKTMWKYPRHKRINNFRKRKYLEHWAHAFLAGIEENVYGLKDDKGIVTEVEVLKTHQMPRLSENFWYPEDLVQSLDSFLTLLKNTVTQDDPNVVYKFDCTQGEIICTELRNPEERYKIIPEWYVGEYNENFG